MKSFALSAVLLSAATAAAAEPAGRAFVPTCPGAGYLPYPYPAVGSCPCGDDGCFHPRRYYADCGDGDPAYKRAFWHRWLRAHFCGGSMLDGLPCGCVSPPGRAVAVPLAPVPAAVPPTPTEPGGSDPAPAEPPAAPTSDPAEASPPEPFSIVPASAAAEAAASDAFLREIERAVRRERGRRAASESLLTVPEETPNVPAPDDVD